MLYVLHAFVFISYRHFLECNPQSSKCHQHKLRPSGHNKNHKKIPKGLIETNSLDTFKRATQFPFNLVSETTRLT